MLESISMGTHMGCPYFAYILEFCKVLEKNVEKKNAVRAFPW